MKNKKLKESIIQAGKSFGKLLPLILGTILLVSFVINLIPTSFYYSLLERHFIIGSFIGSIIGSISVGTPLTSYIIGGELLEKGISIIVITAFIVSWVTVGIIQLPAEIKILGKRFAILRNLIAFISSIIIALIIGLIFNII